MTDNLGMLLQVVLIVLYLLLLAIVSYTDLRWRRIPNRLIYPAILVALVAAFLDSTLLSSLAGGLAGALIFGLPTILLGSHRAGAGDAKLAVFMGLVLTFPIVLYAIALASFSAFFVIVPGALIKHWNRRTTIPFGPFLAFATAIFLLLRLIATLHPI